MAVIQVAETLEPARIPGLADSARHPDSTGPAGAGRRADRHHRRAARHPAHTPAQPGTCKAGPRGSEPAGGPRGPARNPAPAGGHQPDHAAPARSAEQPEALCARRLHQLRTPLAVLKVQVQSAKRGDIPPAQAFAEIDDTVDRATRVANQMLALAKVEQLRQEDSSQSSAMLAQPRRYRTRRGAGAIAADCRSRHGLRHRNPGLLRGRP